MLLECIFKKKTKILMKKLNQGGSLGKSELLQNSGTKLKAKFVPVEVSHI